MLQQLEKNYVKVCIIMEIIVIYLSMAQKFKAKDLEIVPNLICLGNISEDFSVLSTKITRLYGSVFDFSVDYRVTVVDDILGIHKYLMKKNGIVYNV